MLGGIYIYGLIFPTAIDVSSSFSVAEGDNIALTYKGKDDLKDVTVVVTAIILSDATIRDAQRLWSDGLDKELIPSIATYSHKRKPEYEAYKTRLKSVFERGDRVDQTTKVAAWTSDQTVTVSIANGRNASEITVKMTGYQGRSPIIATKTTNCWNSLLSKSFSN